MMIKKDNKETNWNGAKWIRRDKRLAIYLRDGMACVYCGSTVEDDSQLSLDHLTPRSKGGDNKASNLVTCCRKCNSSRGNRDLEEFCNAVAGYLDHGITGDEILDFISETTQRKLKKFRDEAKEIIERRSTFGKAIAEATKTK